MCDYSLHNVATRPARIEDKLVTTKFSNSITRGFAAIGEPHVAVCLLPGTEIAFDENVECEPMFGIGILPNKKIGQRLARFRQINMQNAMIHHDAAGIPGRAGRAAHAPVRRPARDGVAIADRRASCGRGRGSEARSSRAFAIGLNRDILRESDQRTQYAADTWVPPQALREGRAIWAGHHIP